MDPVSLSLGAMAAGMVVKASEELAQKTVDGLVTASSGPVARLVQWLRSHLSGSKELEAGVKYGPSEVAVQELADVIDAEIVDEGARHELHQLVEAAKQEVGVHSVTQVAHGNYNVQAAGNSTVTGNTIGGSR